LAANPIVAVVAAIGLIIGALIAAYNACPEFRAAIDAIGKALGDFFKPILEAVTAALTWLWENVLVPLGNFIVGTFIGVWEGLTAAWHVLSSAVDAVYNGLKWIWDNIFVPIGNFLAGYFMSVLQGLVWVWNTLSTAVNTVYNGLKWLWDNVLVPLGNFIGGALLGAWNAFANGLSWAYNNLIKPVFDALNWVYINVLKPIADFLGTIWNGLSGIGNAVGGFFGGIGKALGFAEGGIVTGPTLALIGEAGPEAVVPLREFGNLPAGNGSGVVNLYAPLITIEGNADRATVEAAAQRVMQKLRTVIVEASSSVASSTRKRIRTGGRF
ncbi:MAG: hypothetical protein NWE95_00650, partial [Candidatus Bathyarchaeota archaeon]|nr:hypothetical protein [Candidatus Bathyarchaeota archaeon]